MLPHANFVFKEHELTTFQQQFKFLKIAFDYSSSKTNHMSIGRFDGMTTHDWHVLMQKFIPLHFRG